MLTNCGLAGVAQYFEVIQLFLKTPALTTRPILIPLQPHISQSIFSSNFLSPMGHHESTATLGRVFEREGWHDPAIGVEILGHSWGTIYSAWILKSFPTLVKRCCLVDPVCFQLWVPDVCSSFIYVRKNFRKASGNLSLTKASSPHSFEPTRG